MPINCGAIPTELMESELFGYEKGAFTGARTRKIGKFEYADGGTIFLDEVSTLPMHMQVKLLRVLQERSFERVGSNVPIKIDIRVVAATNESLEDAVKKMKFRSDLYYRLRVVPIELPPLRERKEDIPLLIEHFLDRYNKRCCKEIKGVTPEAQKVLMDYNWPGNIRELENLMERLVALSRDGSLITVRDIPPEFFTKKDMKEAQGHTETFRKACEAFERRYIMNILNRTNWNRSETANILKVHRNTLLLKMKGLNIEDIRGRGRRMALQTKIVPC